MKSLEHIAIHTPLTPSLGGSSHSSGSRNMSWRVRDRNMERRGMPIG